MDFGKLSDISMVKFDLPDDAPETSNILKTADKEKDIEIYVGCPIWANKGWVGKIYPSNAKSQDYLKHYAQQFNTIELNTTHYRIPDAETIQKWKGQVTQGFKFSPKFPQPISHERLLEHADDLTKAFCDEIRELKDSLGVSFLQLSPHFDTSGLTALKNYVKAFPKDIPLAFEFRHHEWFKNNNFEKAAEILEEYQMSTVITDVAGRRDVLHMRLTTPVVLLRFVGNSLHPTDYSRIDEWIVRLKSWFEQGLKTLYFFAHEPDNTLAPELATYFIMKLNQAVGTNIQPPKIRNFGIQGSLF